MENEMLMVQVFGGYHCVEVKIWHKVVLKAHF